ncbi:MAG: DUF523 and DUF1722 domain-containing protein [Desulfococcaceae bacterium]|jgi:uncharacterized protein YbgA (DUF1722 family)/uncharacterized protein YbbK (DUF523 family)|nr:DUF523 and DUF1722 domain-containing protein [Desulfococcaceae bacterium]
MEKIRLGVSACLLGHEVRYNGGHKLNHYIRDVLGQFADFVPVCPETECGMSIPRETLRLEGSPDNPRLVTGKTKIDHTQQMLDWAHRRVEELEKENLCGFIFKKDSPSSGLYRVKVYNDKGQPVKKGTGMFAGVFTRHFPLLPVEEDGRLNDPGLRENFIESIFVFKRMREMLQKKSRGALVDFHTRHKLLFMAHSPVHYKEMGKLVADGSQTAEESIGQYIPLMAEALCLRATPRKHINVLQHIMGYFKKQLTPDEKQEILEILENYRKAYVPLIVPVTLMNHFVRKYSQPYLREQYYLNPHPLELRLRNHV